MCDRNSLSDPTADFVLSDLLTATEDLINFSINVLDTIRLQTHYNDRNRRVNLAIQLKDVSDVQRTEFGIVENIKKPCTVATTLKYDLALYLDRILLACRRTKANLMLLRVTRTRSTNTTLLIVASTTVRVEQLNKKAQLLTRLVKENGGEFQIKKKKKKKDLSKTKLDVQPESKEKVDKNQRLPLMSKEDLTDYVEIALSFRMISIKYREFIQNIRQVTKSVLSSNGQASLANSIVLLPIAANAIKELNNILNRLIRIAFTTEAESKYIRQPPNISLISDSKELYRQDTNDYNQENETCHSQMLSTDRMGSSRSITPRPLEGNISKKESSSALKRNTYSLLKQNDIRSNIRNQSAFISNSKIGTNVSSFKLTQNMIANIFEDFFMNTNDLFD